MTLARTLTRASAVLSCLLAGLVVLIAGLSPHATASAHPDAHARADTAHAAPRAIGTLADGTRPHGRATASTAVSAAVSNAMSTAVSAAVHDTPRTAAPGNAAIGADRADAGQSCRNHEPVQVPLHVSHLRLRGIATDNRPLHGPDYVLAPHLDGTLTPTDHRPHGFDARPRCLTRRTAAQTSALLQVFRC
ncbi:hypothetical protein Acsp04_20740 [Actinomadura sp. NBRC 104425]|uniref:hypothetical protein n=1 Tax=Actinomadura sp. NBRC 104425 TaxID=3032204 RepID=UPI0024A325E5|nr:hypothetical protein [Actinomadura sp. NBRC 104425]GLZ11839.1 hypothetical protein Acsp04_20740 [Actinomadura sp. NBRC 104425]